MITDIILLLGLLVLSATFSGMEIAFFSLSEAKVQALVEKGVKHADTLALLKQRKERLLSAILIGNNVVNISASAYATVLATEFFGSSGAGIAVGIMTVMVLIFGEITPKAFATTKNTEIALAAAVPMRLLIRALHPVIWLLDHITRRMLALAKAPQESIVSEEEIKAVISQGTASGSLDPQEAEMIGKVFEFDDLTAEDAMTVYKDIFAVDGSRKLASVIKRLVASPFSRIPVYEGDKNNIVGILRLREVLKYIGESLTEGSFDAEILLKDLSSKPYFVPEGKPIAEIMREFKKRHKHIAIVVNEYGDTVGLITMEDILEQLVGQIADESDVDDFIIKRLGKNSILVDGDEEIDEVNDFFNVSIQGPKNNSISWLLLDAFERIPEKGERITLDGLVFEVEAATDRTIEKVTITKETLPTNLE